MAFKNYLAFNEASAHELSKKSVFREDVIEWAMVINRAFPLVKDDGSTTFDNPLTGFNKRLRLGYLTLKNWASETNSLTKDSELALKPVLIERYGKGITLGELFTGTYTAQKMFKYPMKHFNIAVTAENSKKFLEEFYKSSDLEAEGSVGDTKYQVRDGLIFFDFQHKNPNFYPYFIGRKEDIERIFHAKRGKILATRIGLI